MNVKTLLNDYIKQANYLNHNYNNENININEEIDKLYSIEYELGNLIAKIKYPNNYIVEPQGGCEKYDFRIFIHIDCKNYSYKIKEFNFEEQEEASKFHSQAQKNDYITGENIFGSPLIVRFLYESK
uniref:Uncharacterized protein n=1 Tax=viral metagenome TaxID=1070528 RepID=A0A6C0AET8_9ZZZZ